MKVEIKEKEQDFRPIKLEITIENEYELGELCHRLNVSLYQIDSVDSETNYGIKRDKTDCFDLWKVLDGIYESLNK